jgi:hypothetical protein
MEFGLEIVCWFDRGTVLEIECMLPEDIRNCSITELISCAVPVPDIRRTRNHANKGIVRHT